MEINLLLVTARTAVYELTGDDICYTAEYDILIDGELRGTSNRMVNTVYGLSPDTDYELAVRRGEEEGKVSLHTKEEFVTLNVKDFGAKGDGETDDTLSLQAAILSCPENSRVYVPAGTYKFHNLFLKSDLILELGKGAELSAFADKHRLPVLPGVIESYDETSEYNLASWEGNPLDSFASLITGINVKNVLICGQGTLNGNGSFDNWWDTEKRKKDPARPRMLFLNRCEHITVQGITVKNSPAWNLHPYFSSHLRFLDISVESPANSHNTDGLDPESCIDVEIVGAHFSVGDDCIAVKAGKIYMGRKYKRPSDHIRIRQSHMEKGHGAVTVGSEIAAGVTDLKVEKCLFTHTDRGLRIKTRRGRGEDSVLDGIVFEKILMDHVKTPFVINCFYYCDPDGRTEYVSCREPLPIDYRTPYVKRLRFSDIDCRNTHYAGCYFYGLPERKIESVCLENIRITYAKEAGAGKPALMNGCDPVSRMGLFARNISRLETRQVVIEGNEGKPFDVELTEEWINQN